MAHSYRHKQLFRHCNEYRSASHCTSLHLAKERRMRCMKRHNWWGWHSPHTVDRKHAVARDTGIGCSHRHFPSGNQLTPDNPVHIYGWLGCSQNQEDTRLTSSPSGAGDNFRDRTLGQTHSYFRKSHSCSHLPACRRIPPGTAAANRCMKSPASCLRHYHRPRHHRPPPQCLKLPRTPPRGTPAHQHRLGTLDLGCHRPTHEGFAHTPPNCHNTP